ncbi:hypothetical protein ACFLTC_00830 [Chloroflexota bacterium]
MQACIPATGRRPASSATATMRGEPDPPDPSAAVASMDPDNEQGMVAHGAAYQEFSGKVWERQYQCTQKIDER